MRSSLKRSLLRLDDAVIAPNTRPARGASCLTCLKLVDREELVEGYPGESETCKVLVKCHGTEELRTFDMGSKDWGGPELAQMMSRAQWFDPHSHDAAPVGKHGDISREDADDEPKRIISTGST
jgi:hypothetical protein